MENEFELLAFYSNIELLNELVGAGIDGIIIDWEKKGKANRQILFDTQVNKHTVSDLKAVRDHTSSRVICRINGQPFLDTDEINTAIELGADELLVPMIKTLDEVEFVLEVVKGRADVGFMLETNEALQIADQLNKFPISRFFVGLNDLCIQRKSRNIFLPIIDGTIDELRPKLTKRFGMAGLTHPLAGEPVPCASLIKEMKRHKCSFGFLRRSFYRDLSRYSVQSIISALREEFRQNFELSVRNEKITLNEKEIFKNALI